MNELAARFSQSIRQYGNRPAIRSAAGEVLLYGALADRIEEVAAALRSRGVTKDQHVGLFMPNSVEFVIAYWAIHLISATVVLVPSASRSWELSRISQYCDIDHWVTDSSKLKILADALAPASNQDGYVTNGVFWIMDRNDPAPKSRASIILPTSGTSGRLKLVMLSAPSVLWNALAYAKDVGLSPTDKALILLPLTGAFAHTTQMLAHFLTGGEIIIGPSLFLAPTFLRLIGDVRPSITGLVPSLFRKILDHITEPVLRPIAKIVLAGEPIDPALIRLSRSFLPYAEIIKAYGLSEAGPRVAQISSARDTKFESSMGRPLSGVALQIVDAQFQPLQANDTGEICVKSPGVMQGYYKDLNETSLAVRDGWLRTGDLGQLDASGYLTVNGRQKNLIVKNGCKVSPEEIEAFLLTCRGVTAAAVYSHESGEGQERIIAQVVFHGTSHSDEADVVAFCRLHLSSAKVPDEIHRIASLPLLPNGKLDRRAFLLAHEKNLGLGMNGALR